MIYDYIISISYSPQGSISTFLIVIQSTFTFDVVERIKQTLAYLSDDNNLCLIILDNSFISVLHLDELIPSVQMVTSSSARFSCISKVIPLSDT